MTPCFKTSQRACALPLALTLLGLCSGCGKAAEPTPSSATSTAPAAATPLPAGSAPIAGVIPQSEDAKPATGVAGPAAGETAIGGLAGKQDSGGHRDSVGTGSEPTGGDGAASAAR